VLKYIFNKNGEFDKVRKSFIKMMDHNREKIIDLVKENSLGRDTILDEDFIFEKSKEWFLENYDSSGLMGQDTNPIGGAWTDTLPRGILSNHINRTTDDHLNTEIF
jgi:hypothetical protein